MIETIAILFPLIFTNNLVMSAVKYLAGRAKSTGWLRFVLIVLSAVGAIAAGSLTGDPVDFNQLTDWAKLLLETGVLAVGSHASYRVIKNA